MLSVPTCHSLFYALEKAKYNAKTCFKIIDHDLGEITNTEDILETQRKFYLELYDVDKDVNFNMINSSGVYVPQEIKTLQNQKVIQEDIIKAIKGMKNSKTPGKDGIPVDFYKVFWNLLAPPFMEMVEQCLQEQLLHTTAREGVLNLIPKVNKDTRYVKNLRPITLLNTDYKIIEKAIANKILPALEYIIHKDQRGFMKDRRISVNIRKMLDIIHEANKEDLEAVVLSLDFVKCFDKCSFSILHGSLDFFGFGNTIKTWTKILYRDFFVKIQNNGCFSKIINIKKGVHQGGCCSSLYFLIIAEILAISLRANHEIEGITIRDIRNLLNQFADDMDIFSMCTEKSLRSIFEELDAFKQHSGFTISYEKTTLYRIGSLKHSCAQMYNMSEVAWSNKDITVLGVKIAHKDLIQKNYEDLVEKAKHVLSSWTHRGLSLLGKIQVINTLVASLFVYKMLVLPTIPGKIVKQVDNVIREFLWNGRKSKIAYRVLQNPIRDGGVNLVNLKLKDIALKASWPQILSTEVEYSTLVYSIMKCSKLKEDIWRCSIAPEDVKNLKISNTFWKDVLWAWSQYNFFHKKSIENQLIWYNSEIRIRNKPFMWNDIYSKGLKYVYQLFENGCFKDFEVVQEQFGLSKLRYNSLKSAIPREWKIFFCENDLSTFRSCETSQL